MLSLSLVAESRTAGPLVFDLTDADKLASLKKNPVNIKEGSDYAVELKFTASAPWKRMGTEGRLTLRLVGCRSAVMS